MKEINTYLIADSGGTQTDWCFVNELGDRRYFTTGSFHPSQWDELFIEEYKNYWSNFSIYKEAKVIFYGAGCLNEENKDRIKDIFRIWGFECIQVFSDVEAACHASLGSEEGIVAILGTGSVVCKYNGNEIEHLYGGFGYLIGDEGSGYHFGKTVLNKFLNNEFSSSVTEEIECLIGGRKAILLNVYGHEGKQFIGKLSSKLIDVKELKDVHFENLNTFFEKYIFPLNPIQKELYIIGRYGFYQQKIIDNIIHKKGWKVKMYIDKPILFVVNHVLSNTV
ncbi:MAG: hypothetical protein HYR91_00615 [Flavobacteriia bacterium]|nr:hypothetical protein [Flavobacteriia bacterium]